MTVPTSVAIASKFPNNNLAITNQTQQQQPQFTTSCVSLVSTSTNGNAPISIPISIRSSNLAAKTQPQSTMSWAQGNQLQFTAAGQRPNGTISFVPQQTIYQMPNETLLQPQTMLITQPSSRPPDQTGPNSQTTTQLAGQTGSIVQIIQTPNGPAQLISTSTNFKQQPQTTYTTNLTNNSNNTTTTNSKSNKQILPKGSKSRKNNNNNNQNNDQSCTNSNSSSSNNKTMITTTSLASTPTMNSYGSLGQSTLGAPQLMLNPQTGGFFTSNGLFFNQGLPMQMGQQQFIINSAPGQLGTTTTANTQTLNKTTPQNQTILIPSSTANNNQLKLQPTGLLQQPQQSAPQLIQLPNGQMLLVQPTQTSNDQQQLISSYNQPNQQTLQFIQQPDGQTVSYSSGGNFIITSQPSFVNSTISTNNLMTSATNNTMTSTINTATTPANNKSKSRRKPAAKAKDNNKTTTTMTTTLPTTPTPEQNKSKGLNLADLLKEAGIMDSSPPSSPTLLNQSTTTTTTTTDLIDQSLNASTNSSMTPQLTNLDLTDPQSANLLSNPAGATTLGQPTVVMMQPSAPQTGAANYFFNPMNSSIGATAVNTPMNSAVTQPQYKLAFGPDGSVILQSVPTFAQPLNPTTTPQPTVQSSSLSTKFVDTSKVDTCNSGSSQPSPDSTTPTLDTAITSCSPLSLSTSTITFATNQNNSTSTNSSNNSQLCPIKLNDPISLTFSGQTMIGNDELNKSQTISTPANNKNKSRARKSTAKKQTPKTNTDSATIQQTVATPLQQPTQQLITIPSMNSVISGSTTTGIMTPNQPGSLPMATHIDQNGVPVVQVSLKNKDFIERLDAQVKSLSALKHPTPDQKSLLQELKSMQQKITVAKNDIILTSQPLLSQLAPQPPPQTTPDLTSFNKPSSLNNNKLTKDTNVNNANSSNSNINISTSNIPIIAITSKPLDTMTNLQASGKKLGLTSGGLMDQNKQQSTTTSTMIHTQPTQFIFQSAPPNSTIPQDPGHTTNTFEGQKIKILTSANQNQTTSTPQPLTQPGTTFQLGNQFFTITTAGGKNPLQTNQLNTDGSTTQTVFQVVLQQPTTTALNSIGMINTDAKLIKMPDNQVKETMAITPDKKGKSHKFSFPQQLSADLAAASKPDTKTPFKNYNDACKRLLRYHVFYQEDTKGEKLEKFDNDFEVLSKYLLYKKEQLYRRFQFNILKLAMKTHPSAENIMLDKTFVEEEKDCLKNDKELVEKGNDILSDLPSLPYEWQVKVKSEVEEEFTKMCEEQSKKRKVDDVELSGEVTEQQQSDLTKKTKKPDVAAASNVVASDLVVNESDDEEDSEASGEESQDLFNQYLGNLNDINQIDGLSPLYNNSNSYNSIMQMTDHQNTSTTNQSDTNLQSSHHSNEFDIFNEDWPTGTTNNTSSTIGNSSMQQKNKASSSWVQEDADAVESIILDDQLGQPATNYIPNLQSNLDEFDSEAVGDGDPNSHLTFNQSIGSSNDMLFDQQQHHHHQPKVSDSQMNSDNDLQMESAINSILDILGPASENDDITSTHDNGGDQMSANGFNFDANLTSSSQVNYSQNNYLGSMPGMSSRPNTFGTDHYTDQIDEAVKSIQDILS